jgi:hypothetical protein
MKAIPAAQDPAPACGVSDRDDGRLRELGGGDDAGSGAHGRTIRPIGRDADAVAVPEMTHHRAQRPRAALVRRAGDRVDVEVAHGAGDDAAVAVTRDEHVHRRQTLPGHRDHQQPAMPKGEDEGMAGITQSPRDVGSLDGPTAGGIDEADVEMDEPTQDLVRRRRAEQPLHRRSHPQPPTARNVAAPSAV